MSKKVLITGANGGFGKLMVQSLVGKGHEVAASMRGVGGKNKAAADEVAALGAKVVEIDVTSEDSVNQGIGAAAEAIGSLDVVVNNAGRGVLGRQEAFSADDWKALFDVNVFGVQRVMRAVIPHFREKGDGLFVNVSSLLGRIAVPYYGPYNASKWALEALSENYRVELSQFGIDVCLLEPGGYPTTFIENLMKGSDTDRNGAYADIQPSPEDFLAGFEQALAGNPKQDPQSVADALVGLVETAKGSRPPRTVVDEMGMGVHIKGYNEALSGVTGGIYQAFGIDHLLKVKL